jgi:CheY-like chemotaxis protein
MAKVMLVEDDNNLREIYEARLAAEGYEIVSAADGEAALALAIKEKPDLIISDIMMPKVSGFDMLDILRSTTETKNCKIIMMTALNQAEDKARAEKLGADMYLVKSQVTLEDVVRAAKSVLGDQTPLSVGGVPVQHPAAPANATSLTGGTPAPQPAPVTPDPTQTATPAAAPAQVTPAVPEPQTVAAPVATAPAQPSTNTPPAPVVPQAPTPPPVQVSTQPLTVAPAPSQYQTQADPQTDTLNEDKPAGEQVIVKSAPSTPSGEPGIDASISGRKKVIQPITDVLAGGPDLSALAAKEAGASTTTTANTIITPAGATLPSTPPAAPIMNDIIAPTVTPPAPTGTTPLPPPVA